MLWPLVLECAPILTRTGTGLGQVNVSPAAILEIAEFMAPGVAVEEFLIERETRGAQGPALRTECGGADWGHVYPS